MSKATDKLKFSPEEMECLQAAITSLNETKSPIVAYSWQRDDIGRLVVGIIHDKYDQCVEAAVPIAPKAPSAASLQK